VGVCGSERSVSAHGEFEIPTAISNMSLPPIVVCAAVGFERNAILDHEIDATDAVDHSL
jgi:hypothetical protein